MIRVVLPAHLRELAGVGRSVQLEVAAPVTVRTFSMRSKHTTRRFAARSAIMSRTSAVGWCDFSPARKIFRTIRRTPLPEKVATGDEPFVIIGAIAGG